MLNNALCIPCLYEVLWCLTHVNEYTKINAMYGPCNYKAVNWETRQGDGYTTEEYEAFSAAFDAATKAYNDLLHLDFGTSRRIQNGASVVKVIGKKFGVSMRLGLISAGISLVVGVLLGILQTAFKDKVFDWIGTAYTVFVNAVPSLVSYSLVLVFGSKYLGFPTLYSTRNVGPSSVLPIVCLSLASIAGYALWTRRYMVDELTRDYIKLARVKGLSSSEIMFKHVLRNAMVPMVQYIPQSILLTVGGSLLMERFFSVPGMGPLLTDAIQRYDEAERVGYSNYSYWGSVVQNFLKHKAAVVCLFLFLFLVVFSFIALAIGKYDYQTLVTDSSLAFQKPNGEYWFGTDNLGRDYWCQVWYATQVSIRLALIVAVGESILGVIIGLIWGYVRELDRFFTELYNLIDNVPYIIYMTLIALVVGQSFTIMAVSMIAIGWLVMARRVRNMVFMFRDREYNLASRCLGTPLWRVLTKNILPYLVSVIILRMALSIPATINLESTLSYLGIGLGIETPSLGLILSKVRGFFLDYPYLLVFPASIVSIISISFYIMGNAFSDAADPRNHV